VISLSRELGVKKEAAETKIKFFDYSSCTPDNFAEMFSRVNWNNIHTQSDTSAMVDKFYKVIQRCISQLLKQKTRSVKNKCMATWFDHEVQSH